MMFIDARLPVRFGPLSSRRPNEAVLTTQGGHVAPPVARLAIDPVRHPIDCRCCTSRGTASIALAALFRERALANGPPFCSVLAVVDPVDEAAVRHALVSDAFASARYRLG